MNNIFKLQKKKKHKKQNKILSSLYGKLNACFMDLYVFMNNTERPLIAFQ